MTLPLNLKEWTKDLLRHYNISAGKKMGQHFLIDAGVLTTIIATAELKPQDKILEVGGGLGVLTVALLDEQVDLTTIELDTSLVEGLKKLQKTSPRFKVINADIIKLSDEQLRKTLELGAGETFSIVSNLPYEISGAFLRKFLETTLPLDKIVLLLQLEVAERLRGVKGAMSLLGVLAGLNASVEIIKVVNPASFLPPPRVKSAIVRLKVFSSTEKNDILQGVDEKFLWQLCRIGFSSRRKQLTNNLVSTLDLSKDDIHNIFKKIGLNSEIRAQELTVHDWVKLAKNLR